MSRGYQSSVVKIPAKPFISTWNTAITYTGSTANNQIKLPLISDGKYKFTVNWGDNTSNIITTWNQPEVTHTYAAPGTYTVTITGFIKGWDFSGRGPSAPTTGDMRKLLSITTFGCLEFITYYTSVNFAGAFYGCTNLNLSAVQDQPNFKNCTSAQGFLRSCSGLTTVNRVDKWDVSKVTVLRNVFREIPYFNDNVGNWNVSKVFDFAGAFRGPVTVPRGTFNNGGSSSIKNWDMSSAVIINSMFYGQILFNQEIGLWNVSNVTDAGFLLTTNIAGFPQNISVFNNAGSDSIKNWNTSNIVNMSSMFSGQPLFNQPIGSWDTGKVTNMSYMLQCLGFNQPLNNWDTRKVTTMSRMLQMQTIAFNQPLNNWKVPLVTDMINFMRDGSFPLNWSVQNYSDFLIALAAQPLKPNVQLGVNQKYNASAVAARAILTSAPNNWTIIDLGLL